MNSNDAASLLIAVGLSVPKRADAIVAVDRAKKTPFRRETDPSEASDILFNFGLKEISSIPINHSFYDAITALLCDAQTGALRTAIESGTRIEVASKTNRPFAAISFYSKGAEFVMSYAADGAWNTRFDRTHGLEAQLTEAQILKIGEAL